MGRFLRMSVIRSLFRHKLRTVFTVVGIIVGIIAFTVMGAMSEKLNILVSDAINYLTGQISVSAKGGTGMLSSIPPDSVEKIEKVKGVKEVRREMLMLLETSSGIQMGMPEIVEGLDLKSDFVNVKDGEVKLDEGRQLKDRDDYKALVGASIATNKKLDVGDDFKIKGKKFEVIGITEKNMTITDSIVLIPLHNAQRLYVDSNAYLKDLEKKAKEARDIPDSVLARMDAKSREQIKNMALFKVNELSNDVSVSWEKGEDPEIVANRIEDKVEDITVKSPIENEKELKQALQVVNLVILGSALIAVVVGGLSVINTMIMAVHERTREIGVKKAIGAKTIHILIEYLAEAALLGFLGGLVGLGIGAIIVNFINAQTLKDGIQIFQITNRLAIFSIAFSTMLGVIAGVYPAIHAARLNPVEALRYE